VKIVCVFNRVLNTTILLKKKLETVIPAEAGIRSSPSFPCFHRGRLCGSMNPEISKCDFIWICLYWFPAYAGTSLDSRLRGNDIFLIPGFPLPRE